MNLINDILFSQELETLSFQHEKLEKPLLISVALTLPLDKLQTEILSRFSLENIKNTRLEDLVSC